MLRRELLDFCRAFPSRASHGGARPGPTTGHDRPLARLDGLAERQSSPESDGGSPHCGSRLRLRGAAEQAARTGEIAYVERLHPLEAQRLREDLELVRDDLGIRSVKGNQMPLTADRAMEILLEEVLAGPGQDPGPRPGRGGLPASHPPAGQCAEEGRRNRRDRE